jgi:hypothetical protein
MRKVRSYRDSLTIELYPATRICPACGQVLIESYHKRRWIVSLHGMLRVTSHILKCSSCDVRYRPEQEAALALPGYTFGLDVIARIGELRYQQQAAITTIAHQLTAEGVPISLKEVELLSEVFLALVTTVISDDEAVIAELRFQGGIILAIDGVQPEKGNETLYLLRDVTSGRVLVARNLLSSASIEVETLIDEVLALGIPILGVVTDKQESLCLAVERKLPTVPHQLCQYHYLRAVAQPVCEADRRLKKQIRQRLRGIREIEVKVGDDPSHEAAVVRDYCLAVRTVLSEDGKYPLEPAGITLYERLDQIANSLRRALAQATSAKLQRLLRVLESISGLGAEYARLVVAWGWIHTLAHMLDHAQENQAAQAEVVRYATGLPASCPAQLHEMAAHIKKLTRAFAPKLFTYLDHPKLPRTNNELEVFIGEVKKKRRQMTGRKNTCAFILREGRAVAMLMSAPTYTNWMNRFAAVDISRFQERLAELRREEERSKRWRVRRDLKAYLAGLEQNWGSPKMKITPAAAIVA